MERVKKKKGNVENFHPIWAVKNDAEVMPGADLPLVHVQSWAHSAQSLLHITQLSQ